MANPIPVETISGHGTVGRSETGEDLGKFDYHLTVLQKTEDVEKSESIVEAAPPAEEPAAADTADLKWIVGKIEGLRGALVDLPEETLVDVQFTLKLRDGRRLNFSMPDADGNITAEIEPSEFTRNPEDYEFPVDIPVGVGFQHFKGVIRNVNVILGANGTGKSKLLNHLRDQATNFGFPEKVIYVEGGRVVTPPDTVKFDRRNFEQFETLATARTTHGNKRKGPLRDRANEAFLLLKKMGDESRSEHSDRVEEWYVNNQTGDFPRQPARPLEELFNLFHQVFPEINLEMSLDTLAIKCTKNGKEYAPNSLSDGEKQALCLLADIALLADEFSLVIVDEPELNLHPHLAEDLWNAIELRYPECVFIYATHNIAFSLRSQVAAVFVLGRVGESAVAISSPMDLDTTELRPFLGSIPAILASEQCLIVEGDEKSLDSIFYRWVVGSSSLVIEPMGGAPEVVRAVKGAGVWNRIAPAQKIAGVIDRDFKGDEELGEIASDRLSVLDFHEAESYLCHPKVICAIATAIGTGVSIPTEDEITAKIIEFAENSIHFVVAQRVFRKLPILLRPSLERTEARSCSNEVDLLERIKTVCANEKEKADSKFDEAAVEAIFQSEFENCRSLIDAADVDEMLRVFEGKQLLTLLKHYAACPSPQAVARGAYKHLKNFDDYPRIASLRNTLRTILSLTS